MQSNVSGHWTDDQLITHLYGVGPADDHLQECAACRSRLAAMKTNRETVERASSGEGEVGLRFLAAQRRQIYARLEQPAPWWSGTNMRRVASAGATLLMLGGGLVVYEQHHEEQIVNDRISDAQLAAQVSNMAQDSEPQSTAPLQALFVDGAAPGAFQE